MAYGKSGKSGAMDSAVGMCSNKSNPMKQAKKVYAMCGAGSNPDMQKANKLLQKAQMQQDSLRGKSGM